MKLSPIGGGGGEAEREREAPARYIDYKSVCEFEISRGTPSTAPPHLSADPLHQKRRFDGTSPQNSHFFILFFKFFFCAM